MCQTYGLTARLRVTLGCVLRPETCALRSWSPIPRTTQPRQNSSDLHRRVASRWQAWCRPGFDRPAPEASHPPSTGTILRPASFPGVSWPEPLEGGSQAPFPIEVWSGRRVSNPRPRPWQGRALPLSYSRWVDLCLVSRQWPLRTSSAEGQNRTDDTSIFSAVLYQLSYLGLLDMVVSARAECQGRVHAPVVVQ